MTMWLLEQGVRNAISSAERPSAEEIRAFEAGRLAAASAGILTTAGANAEIEIRGVLTDAPNIMAFLFGGGNITYGEIAQALIEADANPEIEMIELRVDSPGGTVAGLFDLLAVMENIKTPIRAVGLNLVASAAYALVSKADEVIAKNRAVQFGSIGVVVSHIIDPEVIDISNTDSPNKRPDASTEDGVAAIREELDAMFEVFAEAIATGRNTDVATVSAEFGRGGMLMAEDALKRGMIDSIAAPALALVNGASTQTAASDSGDTIEAFDMNESELKANHPELYAAVVKNATTAALKTERDRVNAFLEAGQQSGDMATAITAITEGSDMTSTLMVKFMMAGRNRQDQDDRQDDNPSDNISGGAPNAEEDTQILASDKNIWGEVGKLLHVNLEGVQ